MPQEHEIRLRDDEIEALRRELEERFCEMREMGETATALRAEVSNMRDLLDIRTQEVRDVQELLQRRSLEVVDLEAKLRTTMGKLNEVEEQNEELRRSLAQVEEVLQRQALAPVETREALGARILDVVRREDIVEEESKLNEKNSNKVEQGMSEDIMGVSFASAEATEQHRIQVTSKIADLEGASGSSLDGKEQRNGTGDNKYCPSLADGIPTTVSTGTGSLILLSGSLATVDLAGDMTELAAFERPHYSHENVLRLQKEKALLEVELDKIRLREEQSR